jgi:hypothetical protein
MDYAKQIHILDNAIATLNAEMTERYEGERIKSRGEALKKTAILALTDAGCSQMVITAINNVSFSYAGGWLPGGNFMTSDIRNESFVTAYRQSVGAIIKILEQERSRLEKEQQELKEKRDLKIQLWTLVFSAIAAVGAIISIFF